MFIRRSREPVCAVLLLLLIPLGTAIAQETGAPEITFSLAESSLIKILGRSTLGAFECRSQDLDGLGNVGPPSEETPTGTIYVELAVPVASFGCGLGKITSEMHKALKAKEYPLISYAIDEATVRKAAADQSGDYTIIASGKVTVAGVSREIDLELQVDQERIFTFRLTGMQNVLMTDFDIDPPKLMLGTVKTNDSITLAFDLVATTLPGS